MSKSTIVQPPKAHELKSDRRKTINNAKPAFVFEKDKNVVVFNNVAIEGDDAKDAIDLLRMHRYMRPSHKMQSKVYQTFLDRYIVPHMGEPDKHGNYVVVIPTGVSEGTDWKTVKLTNDNMPDVSYMAHHDTVHRNLGYQTDRLVLYPEVYNGNTNMILGVKNPTRKMKKIQVESNVWSVKEKCMVKGKRDSWVPDNTQPMETSNCLGADCTVGVWLITEMIKAGVAGIYVIHNNEEVGCIGSGAMVEDYITDVTANVHARVGEKKDGDPKITPEQGVEMFVAMDIEAQKKAVPVGWWIAHANYAISFDRFGYNSIITHQSGTRTCSEDFSASLSAVLSPTLMAAGYGNLVSDSHGSYTDSNKYKKVIAECTNLSVGYLSQHSDDETQDITFAVYLRDALIKFGSELADGDTLKHTRDPFFIEPPRYGYGAAYGGGTQNYGTAGGNRGGTTNYDPFGDDYYGANWQRADHDGSVDDVVPNSKGDSRKFIHLNGEYVEINPDTGSIITTTHDFGGQGPQHDAALDYMFPDDGDELTYVQKENVATLTEAMCDYADIVAEYLIRDGLNMDALINHLVNKTGN